MGSLMTSSSSAGPIQISKFPEPWCKQMKSHRFSYKTSCVSMATDKQY